MDELKSALESRLIGELYVPGYTLYEETLGILLEKQNRYRHPLQKSPTHDVTRFQKFEPSFGIPKEL